jgi:hypothetical protein
MVSSVSGEGPSALVTVVNRRGEGTSFRASDVLATKDMTPGA